MICTITRADPHLREFVVRNLLAGFSHIVIYDNSHVAEGADCDVLPVMAPFIETGAVTVVPWGSNITGALLPNDDKNGNSIKCINDYGHMADWVAIMDTDEVFYVKDPAGSFGAVNRLLREVEAKQPQACALLAHWRMMYGEHQVLLDPTGLLLDSYPMICHVHHLPKMILQPDRVQLGEGVPHSCECTRPKDESMVLDSPRFKQKVPGFEAHNLHYYARSVEEFITKSEQSIVPYIRELPQSYDGIKDCDATIHQALEYDDNYVTEVRRLMTLLRKVAIEGQHSDGGRQLGPGGHEFVHGEIGSWDVYIFFKARVALRDEWDEAAYLSIHRDVYDGVGRGEWMDGLQHFMQVGFGQKRRSCWVRDRLHQVCIG